MASDKSQDNSNASSVPQDEKNPFIAFRRQVDAQLNSLFGGVLALPSSIYNQGQDHSRMWTQHRHDRLREIEKEEQDAMRGVEKEWERAMRDFEDSEKEVKEWYDKVLRQITQRRDEHLESGMGFGGMERGMQEEVDGRGGDTEAATCPYLPPKEQRREALLPPSTQEASEGCEHPRRWVCERDYPQSRFLDWVWTGWGGPSTTPDMLWHRGHKNDNSRADTIFKDSEEPKEEASKQGPPLSLDDPRVQKAMAAGRCPTVDGADGQEVQGDEQSLQQFLLYSNNSPLQLEHDPQLSMFGTQWRDAYEDLLRSERNEPLTSSEDSEVNERRQPREWLEHLLKSQGPNTSEHRNLSTPTDLLKRMLSDSDGEAQAWNALLSRTFGQLVDDDLDMAESNAKHEQSLARLHQMMRQGLNGDVPASAAGELPETELAAYLGFNPAKAVGLPFDSNRVGLSENAKSTEHTTEKRTNSDGTSTATSTTVFTFDGGRQRIEKHIVHFDADGEIIGNSSTSSYSDQPSPTSPSDLWKTKSVSTGSSSPEQLPTGWEARTARNGQKYYVDHNTRSTTWTHPDEGFVMPKNRNEFERLVKERFSQSRSSSPSDGSKPRLGSGWFWRS